MKDNFVLTCPDCIRLDGPCSQAHEPTGPIIKMIHELAILEDRQNRKKVTTYRPFEGLRKAS